MTQDITTTRRICKHGLPQNCCAICIEERSRQQWEDLARYTKRSIADLERDLCAPDPGLDPEEAS